MSTADGISLGRALWSLGRPDARTGQAKGVAHPGVGALKEIQRGKTSRPLTKGKALEICYNLYKLYKSKSFL